MRRMAQAVAQKHPGVWGLTFEPGVDIFGDLLYANGGSFFDANDKAAFGQPAGVSALTTLLDMTRVDRSTLPSLDAENLFTSGQAAMYIWTSTAQVDIQSRVKFALGVATLPGGTSRAYQFAGTNLAILAPPERQQAAWRFIRFMTSTDSTVDFAIHTGYLPVRQSALKHPRYLEFLRQNPGYRAALEALPYARIEPRIGAWESVRGILDDAVFSALGGHSEPQDVLTRAAQQADDLIGKLLGK
jgi:ABC-type glycerol-3-phosphate transport system substrate-binding protein